MSDERSPNAVDVQLGQRVKARRLEVDMSQEMLAERLGITFQQVQKYEKGVNRIAASRLHDIGLALGVPAHRFFEGLTPAGKHTKAKESAVREALATPEGAALVALFASIKSRRTRARVVELVRSLANGETD